MLAGDSAVIFWVSVMNVAFKSGSVFLLTHIWNTFTVNFYFILGSIPILCRGTEQLNRRQTYYFGIWGRISWDELCILTTMSKPKDWDKMTVFEQNRNVPCLEE